MELFINLPVAGINAAVTDHFEMLFRDMADKTLYELHNRKGFFHIGVIFVAVVMEGNKVAIIVVNPGRGNNGAPQIAPDIFYGSVGVTFIRFCIDIETVFVFTVTAGFYLFKRRADSGFHFTQQGSAESSAEVGIVEVIDIAPETIIAVAAFRNQAVDMRVPFQISAKGVKDHDETGSEVHGLILLKKHTGNNTVHGMEEAVKEGTVTQKKLPELLINREDAMAVDDIYELKGHRSSALHGVEITTGRAEAAVTAERDNDHFIYVVNNRLTWM